MNSNTQSHDGPSLTLTQIRIDGMRLSANLFLPRQPPQGIVLFAHGSGSSRLSPRNAFVARQLCAAQLASVLFDLLSEREAVQREKVFDVELLARRLTTVTAWARQQPLGAHLRVGYFGASTGAAAALLAAATDPEIGAVVCRGGRPDLAFHALGRVHAPTLLIVGGCDFPVVELNEMAYERLRCRRQMAIVEGATHLFEEPGALEEVSRLATRWFVRHLGGDEESA